MGHSRQDGGFAEAPAAPLEGLPTPRHHRGASGPCGRNSCRCRASPPSSRRSRRKSDGGRRLQDRLGVRAQGRPAHRHRGTGRTASTRMERDQVLLGVTGSGKTFTMAKVIEATQRPALDPRAQQDAGRPALRRVPELLPRERGGIFRLLLRLLHARGLCAAQRHLHREGKLDQRADRPHAPLGHALAAGARRRDRGRLRLLHLRHRRRRDLFGHGLPAEEGRAHAAAPASRRSRGAALQAQRPELRARHLPGARRHHRALPLAFRGPRLAHLALRRRDRVDLRIRSAHRPEGGRAGADQDLFQLALRDAQAHAGTGRHPHQERPAHQASRSSTPPAACSRPSASSSAPCSTSR